MVDLHTHSTASDGSLSPTMLMAEAAKRSITAVALTDHDTIGGLEEAEKAASGEGIHFIPGIELEIIWNHETRIPRELRNSGKYSDSNDPNIEPKIGEFHLLGLGIRRPSQGFKEAIEDLGRRRLKRNLEIVDKMNDAGIETTYDEIKTLANEDNTGTPGIERPKLNRHSIGRPHFADFLVKRKIVKNREQAFLRYLGRGRIFYVAKVGMEFEHAAELIRESGGIAVLAHPMSLYLAWGRLPDFIKSLKERGLDGIEAWHPTTKVSSCKRLEELGKKLELSITAGSDFHGAARPDRKLGITAGGKKIDESILKAIARL